MSTDDLFEMAKVIGATAGVDVYEVVPHASGAYILHTSVGKGYLPDDLEFNADSVAGVLTATLSVMKMMAEGGLKEIAAVEEPVESGTVTVGPTKAVKAPKGKKSGPAKALEELTDEALLEDVKTPDAE